MAKKKIYAVRKGHETGLFDTWEACSRAVKGYSGAEFRGFTDRQEAMAYLDMESGSVEVQAAEESAEGERPRIQVPEGTVIAYVDGSFDKSAGRYSFGCVLLTPDGEAAEKSGSGDNPDSLAIRNVAGEMLGAMYAVRWALQNGYSSVEIRYDYEGIEKWATGVWRARMELTQKYADYMKRCAQKITIRFGKVAAHTGDYYNEKADQLAKKALTGSIGIPD